MVQLPGGGFPSGLAGGWAVTLNGAPVFYVINAHGPYVPDAAAESRKFTDPRQREAFSNHRAWVSVDVVGGQPDGSIRTIVLGALGVIAASLMDRETSLVYSTWRDEAMVPGPGLSERLTRWMETPAE
ncbi:MAG: hypothetical protein IT437_02000 [Phycisphaerales bacterium]|nr:hypothetical protein [Phycisphaerales bacterium]